MNNEQIIEIVNKQLNDKTKGKIKRMYYYESIPLNQIHIDTFFYNNDFISYKYPFLMIVDVATRYINIVPQKRKNENILQHLINFCREVREKFPNSVKKNKEVTIISDAAKEFNVLNKDFNHKLSTGINKAVIAESYIGQVKILVRKVITKHYIESIFQGKIKTIKADKLLEMLKIIQDEINSKAKIKKKKILDPKDYKPRYLLGTPVFARNNEKFYQQLSTFKKKSYRLNYHEEPFYISKIVFWQGIYKYAISSYFDHSTDIHYHYENELKEIDPRIVEKYIKNYNIAYNSKLKKKSIL